MRNHFSSYHHDSFSCNWFWQKKQVTKDVIIDMMTTVHFADWSVTCRLVPISLDLKEFWAPNLHHLHNRKWLMTLSSCWRKKRVFSGPEWKFCVLVSKLHMKWCDNVDDVISYFLLLISITGICFKLIPSLEPKLLRLLFFCFSGLYSTQEV